MRSHGTVDQLIDTLRDIITTPVEDDGLEFDSASVAGAEIRLDARYGGTRLQCRARLGNARLSLQVDVGHGDVITPEAQPVVYPALLDFDPPELLGYTQETAIAEKLEAMVVLDMANTRMKDFLDIWTLAQRHAFDGTLLSTALAATFQRRATAIPDGTPIALTDAFHSNPTKRAQRQAYLRKTRISAPPSLMDTTSMIATFAVPVLAALRKRQVFNHQWAPGGGWRPA